MISLALMVAGFFSALLIESFVRSGGKARRNSPVRLPVLRAPGTCQALAMDEAASLGKPGSRIPPCDRIGSEDRHGFLLCPECAQAFDTFMGIADRVCQQRAKERDGIPTSEELEGWLP